MIAKWAGTNREADHIIKIYFNFKVNLPIMYTVGVRHRYRIRDISHQLFVTVLCCSLVWNLFMNLRLLLLLTFFSPLLHATSYFLELKDLAEKEDATAEQQLDIAFRYDNGLGVTENNYEASNWYLKAAKRGNATAQFNLAIMYLNGEGLPIDELEALRWFRSAAEQGDSAAQARMGYIYTKGQGVPVDIAEAMRWYTKAAKQGDPDAQNALGYIYAKGQGTAADNIKAYIWWTLSEAQGNQQAARGIDTISLLMSEQQIQEAQRLTIKCFNSEQQDCY